MNEMSAKIMDELIKRYPMLTDSRKDIINAFNCICGSYVNGGKLLTAGNGGSAADAEHIAGELLKSFRWKRSIKTAIASSLIEQGEDGAYLANHLEGALPAIALTSQIALPTAFANDVDPLLNVAQLVLALGNAGDTFMGISTSGNAKNLKYAILAAKAAGVKTIGLTGRKGGKFRELCDILICVPEDETYKIQEMHLPVYHALCAMVEAEMFSHDI